MVERHTQNQVLDHYEQTHRPPPMSEAVTDPARHSLHLGVASLVCISALGPIFLALLADAPAWLALAAGAVWAIAIGVYCTVWRGWIRFPIGLAIAAVCAIAIGYYAVNYIDLGY